MKKTLAWLLLGVSILSGCAQTARVQQSSPVDAEIARITRQHHQLPMYRPEKTRVDTRNISLTTIRHTLQEYYGVPEPSRSLYLIEDLLHTTDQLSHVTAQYQTVRTQNQELRQQLQEREQEVYRLEQRLRQQSAPSQQRSQQTHIIYQQVAPRQRTTHPVDERALFMRIGSTYYVFPGMVTVCPDRTSNQRGCIDIRDVIRQQTN